MIRLPHLKWLTFSDDQCLRHSVTILKLQIGEVNMLCARFANKLNLVANFVFHITSLSLLWGHCLGSFPTFPETLMRNMFVERDFPESWPYGQGKLRKLVAQSVAIAIYMA
ncbi:hypothetical protein E2542_SST00483 [Spatholobus suberectus]|nr:hypothetical protein E2542_SST00483 [Spatholobus suberectus]